MVPSVALFYSYSNISQIFYFLLSMRQILAAQITPLQLSLLTALPLFLLLILPSFLVLFSFCFFLTCPKASGFPTTMIQGSVLVYILTAHQEEFSSVKQ